MVVFANHRLGPSAELLVSREVAAELLREVADSARPSAQARWEHELVTWLERCATSGDTTFDVSDIAWTPEHFERQRRFVVEAIELAAVASVHASALHRWSRMVASHPRTSVQVGRRWQWSRDQTTARNN